MAGRWLGGRGLQGPHHGTPHFTLQLGGGRGQAQGAGRDECQGPRWRVCMSGAVGNGEDQMCEIPGGGFRGQGRMKYGGPWVVDFGVKKGWSVDFGGPQVLS